MLCNGYGKTADELVIGLCLFGPLLVATMGVYLGCIALRWRQHQRRRVVCHQFARGRKWNSSTSIVTPILAFVTRGAARRNCYAMPRSTAWRRWH